MLQFLVKHSLQSYTSECGRQPDRMMLGLNLSRGRGCSSLELSSSMEDSEASDRGENWSASERRETKTLRTVITPIAMFPGSKVFGCIVCTLYMYNREVEESLAMGLRV